MAAPRDEPGSVEAEGSSGRQGSSGVKVVLPSDLATPAPLCPHGRSASGFSLAVGRQGGVSYPESTLGIWGSWIFTYSPTPSVTSRKCSFLGKLGSSTSLNKRRRKVPTAVVLAPRLLQLF